MVGSSIAQDTRFSFLEEGFDSETQKVIKTTLFGYQRNQTLYTLARNPDR